MLHSLLNKFWAKQFSFLRPFINPNINSINFNLGFYDKLFKIDDESISNDLAFTFGMGVEYLNDNSFTISLESGKRYSSEYDELKDEKYYKLTFSFISNTMWFIKEGN